MRKFLLAFFASSLLLALMFAVESSVLCVAAEVQQGDLVLSGNDVYVIENQRFDINGSIIVEENATLVLTNAVINFTQATPYQHNMTLRNPVNGNPRLQSENSTITSDYWFHALFYQNSSVTFIDSTHTGYLELYESATAFISNSTIRHPYAHGSSVVSISNSTISYVLSARDSAVVSVSDSTVELLDIEAVSVNCTFANIVPGPSTFWNFRLNSSMVIAAGGRAPNVTIRDTGINGWRLRFHGSTNASIVDSQLEYLVSYSYSNVWVINSTAIFQFYMKGKVYVSWYLDVHVIDSIGQDVPLANVIGTYPNTTLAESEPTDDSGWARLTLMEKMINATDSYPVGNYTVEATYEPHSNSTTVNMTENQIITLKLEDFVIPEFPSLIILPLFLMATLLATVFYRRKLRM